MEWNIPKMFVILGMTWLLWAACAGADQTPTQQRESLSAALQVADWLQAMAVSAEQGTYWPADAKQPSEPPADLGLGVGSPGPVLFWLALHEAAPGEHYLAEAQKGADYLLPVIPHEPDGWRGSRSPAGLYSGLPGIGFALHEVFLASGDPRYRQGALQCLELVHGMAHHDQQGASWNEYNDVLSGTAGTGLFLLYAHRSMGHAPSLDLAVQAGRKLLAAAVEVQGGLTWPVASNVDMILPNFSHGAAGIGYFLATLYQQSGQREFLQTALASAAYLKAVARSEDDVFLVPYGFPLDEGWDRPFDIGWAHGPAGTARLFFRLWQISGDESWLELVRGCATGIRSSGLPGAPGPDFGKEPFPIDRRFGTAGAAEFFLSLHRHSGQVEQLEFARRLIGSILDRATRDSQGLHWSYPRYSFMGEAGQPAAFTGYFYGAAGFGLLLLQLDAIEQGRPWTLALPDDPFGSGFRRQASGFSPGSRLWRRASPLWD